MNSSIKTIIGVVLLLVGAWVIWSGVNENETMTIVLGVASVLGGLAFILTRGRGDTSSISHRS